MVRIVFDVQRLMVGATAEVLLILDVCVRCVVASIPFWEILDVLCCECAVL